jgi:hypothetical protein
MKIGSMIWSITRKPADDTDCIELLKHRQKQAA